MGVFQDVIDGALHEIGLGGISSIQKHWKNNIQDYALRLQKEDNKLIQQYQQLSVRMDFTVFCQLHVLCFRVL
jgi:hypothetical protein